MGTDFKYDVFISYRRSDGSKAANKLHRMLSRYKLPKSLRKARNKRRLKVYLDKIYEKGTNDFFGSNIEPALKASKYLVIVTTPNTLKPRADGQPNWVEREIDTFRKTKQGENLLVIRAEGLLNDPLPGNLLKYYPNIEVIDFTNYKSKGWSSNRRKAMHDALLKLVAPLFDIPTEHMPELREEEARRRQHFFAGFLSVSLILLLIISGLAIFAFYNLYKANENLIGQLIWRAKTEASQSRFLSAILTLAQGREIKPNDQELLANSLNFPDWMFFKTGELVVSNSENILKLSDNTSVMLTIEDNKTIRIRRTKDGNVLFSDFVDDLGDRFRTSDLSPDGRYFAYVSQEHIVKVLCLDENKSCQYDIVFEQEEPKSISISKGGDRIAIGFTNSVLIYELNCKLQEFKRTPNGPNWEHPSFEVEALSFDRVHPYLLIGLQWYGATVGSGEFAIWDFEKKEWVQKEPIDLPGVPKEFTFSDDGTFFAFVLHETNEVYIGQYDKYGHFSGKLDIKPGSGVALSPKGNYTVIHHEAGTYIYSKSGLKESLVEEPISPPFGFSNSETLISASGVWSHKSFYAELSDPNYEIDSEFNFTYRNTKKIETSPSGETFISIQANGEAYLWYIDGVKQCYKFQDQLEDADFHDSRNQLLTVSTKGKVKVWSFDQQKLTSQASWTCISGMAQKARFKLEDDFIFIDCQTATEIWPISGGDKPAQIIPLESYRIIQMDHHGFLCLFDNNDAEKLYIGNCEDRNRLRYFKSNVEGIGAYDYVLNPGEIISRFSIDGSKLAIIEGDHVEVWPTETLSEPKIFIHYNVASVAFDLTGSIIATGSLGTQPASRNTGKPESGEVKIWDLESSNELISFPNRPREIDWGRTGAVGNPPGVGAVSLSFSNFNYRPGLIIATNDRSIRVRGNVVPLSINEALQITGKTTEISDNEPIDWITKKTTDFKLKMTKILSTWLSKPSTPQKTAKQIASMIAQKRWEKLIKAIDPEAIKEQSLILERNEPITVWMIKDILNLNNNELEQVTDARVLKVEENSESWHVLLSISFEDGSTVERELTLSKNGLYIEIALG
jgi:hypothetical protein